jgi:hypothetical protein
MKKMTLIALLSLFSIHSFAQGLYGVEAGVGKSLAYTSYYTPAVAGYYMARINRHIYVGAEVSYQRYSFLYTSGITPKAVDFGDVINIRQKSSYLFFSPKIDFGIGYRKYLHLNFSAGGGIYMGGSSWTNKYEQIFTLPAGTSFRSDTALYNTTYNIPSFIYRYAAGLSERIPTNKYWNIVFSQEFSYIARKLNYSGPNLNTNYIAFTVGIMHKYPQVLVEY